MSNKIVLYELESECCGCSACYAVCPKKAIKMEENEEGFLYPEIDEKLCIQCEACIKVCPLKSEEELPEIKGKRAGILCLSHKQNYGAKIVAWALQSKVKELLGDDSEVGLIEYEGREERRFLEGFSQTVNPAEMLKSAKRFLANRSSTGAKDEVNRRRTDEQRELRKARFDEFNSIYLNTLGSCDRTLKFKAIAENQDAVIVGSDIVFRPQFAKNFWDVYFLGCFKNTQMPIKKISYAAAIAAGEKELKELRENYKDGMKNFDAVSVRERFSQEFLQSLTDKKINYCCDPVMLYKAGEFDFVKSLGESGYIYVNILDNTENAVKFTERLAREKGLEIKFFTDSNYFENGEDVFSDGPLEFIDRIRSADYVVTNSFHTCVFSILFHKKFVAFLRADQSLKINDLLNELGLTDRIVTGKKSSFDIDKEIDWNAVDKKRNALRENSLAFLKEALL